MLAKILTSSFTLPFSTNDAGDKASHSRLVLLDKDDAFWIANEFQGKHSQTLIAAVLSWLNYYDPQPQWNFASVNEEYIYSADLDVGNCTRFSELVAALDSVELTRLDCSPPAHSCAIVVDGEADAVDNSYAILVQINAQQNQLYLAYRLDVLTQEQASYLANHFRLLIQVLTGSLDFKSLNLLSAADHQFLVNECNQTSQELGIKSISDYINSQAHNNGQKIALRYKTHTSTFADLQATTARISSALQQVITAGTVGVYIPRSQQNVMCLLGIWRAGLTYLPLPVDYPADQLSHICAEAGVALVLVSDACSFPAIEGIEVINIDQFIAGQILPDQMMDLDAVAAIMYTSGTTGMPKGVKHTMRSLLNRFGWWLENYPPHGNEVLCQRTSVSFIPSLWEMVSGVVTGSSLVVLADEEARAPELLKQKIMDHGIARIALLPSFLTLLLHSDKQFLTECQSLKYLILAGEPVSGKLMAEIHRQAPTLIVINDYGATEVNGVLSCDSTSRSGSYPLPAGRPIANCQAYILDDNKKLLPCGVKGELYIGGVAACSSYVNLPEANNDKYIDLDLGTSLPRRLFRTNDQATRFLNGDIQILGRRDNMVKVRGIRVELESVERAILQLENISEVAATAETTRDGVTRLVALVVKTRSATPLRGMDVVESLRNRVTESMLPARVEIVAALPKTRNGKLDRKALAALVNTASDTKPTPADDKSFASDTASKPAFVAAGPDRAAKVDVLNIKQLRQCLAEVGGLKPGDISEHDEFSNQGIDSATAVSFMDALSRIAGKKLPVTLLFEYPTPGKLSNYLNNSGNTAATAPTSEPSLGGAGARAKVAIVGMACRMPQAKDTQGFWQNLVDGKDCVGEIPPDRWDWREFYSTDAAAPGKTNSRWGAFLADIDQFDPRFFNISGFEAKLMAPEQRLLLQTSWLAIEDAGYAERDLCGGKVGVFIGARPADYMERITKAGIQADATTLLGNDNAILAARIAYYMNLKGPVITLDTACSSSAVAIHMACESIARGESHLALAGGVSLVTTPTQYLVNTKAGMLSPDGRCKTFDQSANGFVQGEGCGVVVLKPLQQALADQDRIYAVIEASAINQDGKTNGITAPNGDAQKKLLASLYDGEQINAADLAFIEAHGTGTKLGDPIEFDALNAVLGPQIEGEQRCALGSVKTNIGHLISAAGIAGLIKVALSLHHKKIPQNLHYQSTNEHIDLAASPFFVNTNLLDLPDHGRPALAGLSSFGFSGTNCHMVLGAAPRRESQGPAGDANPRPVFICLNAKDPAGVTRNLRSLRNWLAENPQVNLHDLSYTLARRANQFAHSLVCVAQSFAEVIASLDAAIAEEASPYIFSSGTHNARDFSGQHFAGLAEQLIASLARSQDALDQEAINTLALLLVGGVDADIRRLFAAHSCQLLSPPGFVFETERFWIDEAKNTPASAITSASANGPRLNHPEADTCDFSPTPGQTAAGKPQWVFSIPCASGDYQDHRIHGEIWWPATAQLATLKRVAHHLGVEQGIQLSDWRLLAPCILNAATTTVTLTIAETAPGSWQFEFACGNQQLSEGQLKATASYGTKGPQLDLAQVRGRCARVQSVADFYQKIAALGIEYGPGYRRIARMALGSDRAANDQLMTKITAPDRDSGSSEGFSVELLDAALHGVAAGLGGNSQQVPVAVGKLVLLGEIPLEFGTYAQIKRPLDTHTEVDIWLFNPAGEVFCWISSLQLQTVVRRSNSLDNADAHHRQLQPLVFAPRWFDSPAKVVSSNCAICWIGTEPGPTMKAVKVVENFPGYLEAIERIKTGGNKFEKILWSIAQQSDTPLSEYCWQFIDFVTRLARVSGQAHDIIIICEHRQDWSNTLLALSGTLASLSKEYPAITIKLVHGMTMDSKAIEAEILTDSVHSEVNHIHSRRLVPIWCRHQAAQPPATTRAAEVSLITGGMGGVGRALAQQLAQHSGQGIVLVGRRLLGNAENLWLKSLRKNGAEIIYLQADVSNLSDCERLMRQIKRRFDQLDTIYHCAGVTRDALAINKTREQIHAVISAKVDSCEYLDASSRQFALKKFILFSSISAVLGTLGQTDYGAANAYLDAFARRRNRAPDTSGHAIAINWPLWDVDGMRPDPASENRLQDTMGMFAMPPAIGIALIEQLVADKLDQAMVLYGDEPKLVNFLARSLPYEIQHAQVSA